MSPVLHFSFCNLLTHYSLRYIYSEISIQKTKIIASGPITSCKYMGKQWKQWQTIFLGSKITADGNYSHEINRHLLFRRKAVINLDSILKSRDTTLLTKLHIVKSMTFPVIIYEC